MGASQLSSLGNVEVSPGQCLSFSQLVSRACTVWLQLPRWLLLHQQETDELFACWHWFRLWLFALRFFPLIFASHNVHSLLFIGRLWPEAAVYSHTFTAAKRTDANVRCWDGSAFSIMAAHFPFPLHCSPQLVGCNWRSALHRISIPHPAQCPLASPHAGGFTCQLPTVQRN